MAELGEWGDDPAFLRDLGRDVRRLNLRFCALDRPAARDFDAQKERWDRKAAGGSE